MQKVLQFILLVILGLLLSMSITAGFIQELILYDNPEGLGGNSYRFESNVEETSGDLFENVTWICARGVWHLYPEPQRQGTLSWYGSPISPNLECQSREDYPWDTHIKSFHHFGQSNTDTRAITLYSGSKSNAYGGPEKVITQGAAAGLNWPTEAIVVTGKSTWRIFEGPYFDGKSVCLDASQDDWIDIWWVHTFPYNWTKPTTVGSVFRGCDFNRIKAFLSTPLTS